MLVLVLVTPLVPVVQSEPAYRQSAFLPPLGRSAQGRYQGPSQVQHIVHVPDQRSNGFNGFSSGGGSDGWGWNGVESCRVNESTRHECIDSDGDGWGWDGIESCRV